MTNKNKCEQCGYEWDSRKENPVSCPKCKRYDWDKTNTDKDPCRGDKNDQNGTALMPNSQSSDKKGGRKSTTNTTTNNHKVKGDDLK